MSEIIYKGLVLKSLKGCKFYEIKEGTINSLVEDPVESVLTLTYVPGSTLGLLSDELGIELLDSRDTEITSTGGPKKFTTSYVTLNGLRFQKLTADPHIFHMVIVSDSESRVVQDYGSTTIVVSAEDTKNQEFIDFLFFSGGLRYLRPVGAKPKCYEIKNFPKLILKDSDVTLESGSSTVYTLRRRYDDYVIRAIDYQDQFILELRRILSDYGVELVRWNREETLVKTSYVSYRFDQTPSRVHHPNYRDDWDRVMQHRLPVEFTLRTPDTPMFFDFKNKYNNVDLLTNLCEFKTSDRYGERWTAAVKWGQITEDFNHQYQSDDNSNFSNQCQFRAELYFYEVLDDRYQFLEEINVILNATDDVHQRYRPEDAIDYTERKLHL